MRPPTMSRTNEHRLHQLPRRDRGFFLPRIPYNEASVNGRGLAV